MYGLADQIELSRKYFNAVDSVRCGAYRQDPIDLLFWFARVLGQTENPASRSIEIFQRVTEQIGTRQVLTKQGATTASGGAYNVAAVRGQYCLVHGPVAG